MKLDDLTESERFIVKWQYSMLGGFKSALVLAIAKADTDNRARLERGFPNEVDGYRRFAEEYGWWENVQRKAGLSP